MPIQPCWDLVKGDAIDVRANDIYLGGQILRKLDIWRLACALDDTAVEASSVHDGSEVVLSLHGFNSGKIFRYASPSVRLVEARQEQGKTLLVLVNRGYYLPIDLQHVGHAWATLALQVEVATRLGFSHIVAQTQGGENLPGNSQFSGYYSWPRMGFDGLIPESIWAGLDPHILTQLGLSPDSPTNVSELMKTPLGRTHWRKRGAGFTVKLVLDPMSSAAASLLGWLKPWPSGVR